MSTLEKIRADIENIKDFEVVNGGLYVRQYDVVQIIDKYAEQELNLERLKDKLHDKIEIYVCEVEENTLIAQGMLKALGMMDEVLENAEKGGE